MDGSLQSMPLMDLITSRTRDTLAISNQRFLRVSVLEWQPMRPAFRHPRSALAQAKQYHHVVRARACLSVKGQRTFQIRRETSPGTLCKPSFADAEGKTPLAPQRNRRHLLGLLEGVRTAPLKNKVLSPHPLNRRRGVPSARGPEQNPGHSH